MKKRYLAFSVLLVFLLACQGIRGAPTPTATALPFTPTVSATVVQPTSAAALVRPTSTPAGCIPSEPTQADIDRALTYPGQAFSAWERSYSVMEARVAVTWKDSAQGTVAYIEALIFSCGYTKAVLDDYFNATNWQLIFDYYDSYEQVAQCEANSGIRLYQFRAKNKGLDYMIGYWVQEDTKTRVMVAMFVFPLEAQDRIWIYGAEFFPALPNCS